MSYPYFFVEPDSIEEDRIKIRGEDLNHLKNVLRARTGDTVCVSDNSRNRYETEVLEICKDKIILAIRGKKEIEKKFPEIVLFQCVLKKNSMEFVIQKSTEIGVDLIVPVISERVVVDNEKITDKVNRWQKISDAASGQSKRDFKCRIASPENIYDIMVSEYDFFFIPYEKSAAHDRRLVENQKILSDARAIAFIIGPEGGFEASELDYLKESGATEIRLGKNVYRSETAAIYFLSVLDYLIGNKKWGK